MDDFSRYQVMRDSGATPREVYLAAKQHRMDEITSIRMLRAIFSLSLIEAKQATIAEPLADQQTKLVPALNGALEDLPGNLLPKK
jgi:hypothetical protein